MNEFKDISTTGVYIARNALIRELHLRGKRRDDSTHSKSLRKGIEVHQQEIDRRGSTDS